MKWFFPYFSVTLIALTLITTTWQTAKIIHFYAYQDVIEAEHCVNKDKPELNCHGKCYLKDQLQSNKQLKSLPTKSRNLNSLLVIFQLYEDIDAISIEAVIRSSKCIIDGITPSADGYPSSLLDPPRFC